VGFSYNVIGPNGHSYNAASRDSNGYVNQTFYEEQGIWWRDMPLTVHGETVNCYFLPLSQASTQVIQVGLSSYLNVYLDEYVINTVSSVANRMSAITVEFTDPTKMPSPLDGAVCFLGQQCIFSSRRVVNEHYHKDGNPGSCMQNVDSSNPYSTTACEQECLRNYFVLSDNHEAFAPPSALNSSFLQPDDMLTTERSENCASSCPHACQEIEYVTDQVASPLFLDAWDASEAVNIIDTNNNIYQVYTSKGTEPAYVDSSGAIVNLTCGVQSSTRYGFTGVNGSYTSEVVDISGMTATQMANAGITAFAGNCGYQELQQYTQQHSTGVVLYLTMMDEEMFIESRTTEFSGLLAGLGGNMGLFLGISGMTIFEWLEFWIMALLMWTCCGSGIPGCHVYWGSAWRARQDAEAGGDLTVEIGVEAPTMGSV
jgi:hypothetical protein